jgi:hypothetical protein
METRVLGIRTWCSELRPCALVTPTSDSRGSRAIAAIGLASRNACCRLQTLTGCDAARAGRLLEPEWRGYYNLEVCMYVCMYIVTYLGRHTHNHTSTRAHAHTRRSSRNILTGHRRRTATGLGLLGRLLWAGIVSLFSSSALTCVTDGLLRRGDPVRAVIER